MAKWPPEFQRPGAISLHTENKPFIETLDELDPPDDGHGDQLEEEIPEEDEDDSDEEATDVGKVMRYGQSPGGCVPQATKVENFCRGDPIASLARLRSGIGRPDLPIVAWLHESGCRGTRSNQGPLAANSLYKHLKEPRFSGSTHSAPLPVCPACELRGLGSKRASSDGADEERPDAERQRIFIADLDAWNIHALFGTASKSQMPHLEAAVYKHLAFEPFFGFDLTPQGLSMFRLAFYLPYYVLKHSKVPRRDPRVFSDGKPLRGYIDISFLESKHSDVHTFLYEAQVSCVIAGSDIWTWIAYCFVDTYFDSKGRRETVSSYYEPGSVGPGISQDPFTRGQTPAEGTFNDPREYFLTVLRYRLEQILNEWMRVVQVLETSIHEHKNLLLSSSRRKYSSKSRDFVTKLQLLSQDLLSLISQTVNSYEEFCHQPAFDFRSVSDSTDRRHLLVPIRSVVNELRLRKTKLESLAETTKNITTAFELHLNKETIQLAHLSVKTVLFISPIGLAAAILSMDDRVLPMPLNFLSFLYILLAFGVIAFVIHLIQSDQFWFVQDALSWTGYVCLFKLPSLNLSLLRLPKVRKLRGASPRDEERRGNQV